MPWCQEDFYSINDYTYYIKNTIFSQYEIYKIGQNLYLIVEKSEPKKIAYTNKICHQFLKNKKNQKKF